MCFIVPCSCPPGLARMGVTNGIDTFLSEGGTGLLLAGSLVPVKDITELAYLQTYY